MSNLLPYLIIGCIIGLVSSIYQTLKTHKRIKREVKNELSDLSIESDLSLEFSFESHLTSKYSDYGRYFQTWDKNYDKDLGYEWFRICVERLDFPIYNSLDFRLRNIRNGLGFTQSEASNIIGISTSTLSSYENGYTIPNDNYLQILSKRYRVSFDFIKYGYDDDFEEHIKLCERFGEEEYIHSLRLSVTAASRLFPEILTSSDRHICILVDDILNLKLDLFNKKANDEAELRVNIKADILNRLEQGDIIQSELYKSFENNRYLAQSIVKELHEGKIISKTKKSNTFILSKVLICMDASNE
ncbi:MAG: helix-turn-helix domain-containing protein [Oscillospiraceae bacterium]|nr:helix-turn-helix domain-containing protein [Oscillospiraceae bacterium]